MSRPRNCERAGLYNEDILPGRCPCVGGKRDASIAYGRHAPEGTRPEIRVAVQALPSTISRLNGDKDSFVAFLSSFFLIPTDCHYPRSCKLLTIDRSLLCSTNQFHAEQRLVYCWVSAYPSSGIRAQVDRPQEASVNSSGTAVGPWSTFRTSRAKLGRRNWNSAEAP